MADSSGTIGSGGTYTDVPDWEDSIDISTDSSIGSMLDGFEETSAVDINGATPTATNIAELTADSGAQHDGRAHEVSAAGNARMNFSGANQVLAILDPHVHVTWLEIKGPGNNNNATLFAIFTGTSTIFIHHCIIHNNQAGTGSNQELIRLEESATDFRIYRNILYGAGAGCCVLYSDV